MPKYVLVIELPQRKEFIQFHSYWAMRRKMRELKAEGIECHIAK